MRVERPHNFVGLSVDGAVISVPGVPIALASDYLPSPSADELADFITSLRGEFLSKVFPVENEMVMLRLAARFSTDDAGLIGAKSIDYENEIRRQVLGEHIKQILSFSGRYLDDQTFRNLCQNLEEIRRVRNLLAHRPCWLEPVWDPLVKSSYHDDPGLTTSFNLIIADDQFIWKVDHQQRLDWLELIDRCAPLYNVRPSLLKSRTPPQPLQRVVGFPAAIILPRGDPLGHHSDIRVSAIGQVTLQVQSLE